MKRTLRTLGIVMASFCWASLAAAATPKTLISYEGGTVTPGLASEAKSLGAGKYQFTLGAHKVGGSALTPAMVKSSVEEKLKANGVSVTAQGANVVVVNFTGDEPTFLQKIAKVRIKDSANNALASEDSTSDGGIRARIPSRTPKPDEVQAKFVKAAGDKITVVIVTPGKQGLGAKVKPGQSLVVGGAKGFQAKANDQFLFTPKSDKPWVGANFTFE